MIEADSYSPNTMVVEFPGARTLFPPRVSAM